jgi:hypothetical protein
MFSAVRLGVTAELPVPRVEERRERLLISFVR